MNVLVLFAHPVRDSYCAALHRTVVEELTAAGHQVDDCDLYAEGFDPVMSEQDRLDYHSYPKNIEKVAGHVERLRRAEALVIVAPVWNFGYPAILKGYFDKVWAPGVNFEIRDGKLSFTLTRLKTILTVATFGATPLRAFLAGNPPKKFATRALRANIGVSGKCRFLAHYAMDQSTPQTRAAFIEKVKKAMRGI